MSLLEQYLTASFRGVQFQFTTESTTEGRKIVTHEFVNSDKRIDEDLGAFPPIFTLSAFVHGDDAFTKRDNLRRALDAPGRGDLIHPTRGRVLVTAKQYSISSNATAVGRINFQLTFDATEAIDAPQVSQSSEQEFAAQADTVRALVTEIALENYITPKDSPHSILLGSFLEEGMDGLQGVTNSIEDIEAKADPLTSITSIIKRPTAFLATPNDLFPQLESIYSQTAGIGSTDSWLSSLDSLPEVPVFASNIIRGVEQNKSFGTVSSVFQVNSLLNGYHSAIRTTFDTVPELNLIESRLNGLFSQVVENAGIHSIAIDPDLKARLLQTRVVAQSLFNEKEQKAWKVKPFNPIGRGLATTSYMLYESNAELDLIARLNPGVNANHPQGLIESLSR